MIDINKINEIVKNSKIAATNKERPKESEQNIINESNELDQTLINSIIDEINLNNVQQQRLISNINSNKERSSKKEKIIFDLKRKENRSLARQNMQKECPIEINKTESQDITEQQQVEILFIQSGTSPEMKEKWIEIYNEAQISRKRMPQTMWMKAGKFGLTDNGELFFTSKYKTYNKNTKEILKDKWI